MHACGECLKEALKYGQLVRHRNGDEGIDELWGEPFKAFIMSIEDFYQSRYIKIALTMKNIDQVADYMITCLKQNARYQCIDELILHYATMARRKCETLRTDDDIFDIWSDFVVAGEGILAFEPLPCAPGSDTAMCNENDIQYMLEQGVKLISFITRARTSMPKSTENYLDLCQKRLQARLG